MADHDLFTGLIRLHVLHHASVDVVFGLGMIQELRRHGYRVGPGTLYPMLHSMEERGFVNSKRMLVGGKSRRVYTISKRGKAALEDAKEKVHELFHEMFEDPGEPSPAHPKKRGKTSRQKKS